MLQLERLSGLTFWCTFALIIILTISMRFLRTNGFKFPPRAAAVLLLVFFHSMVISFAIGSTYFPYKNGHVVRISRYGADRLILLTEPGAAHTLTFNVGLAVLVLLGGTYLCWLGWRRNSPKS